MCKNRCTWAKDSYEAYEKYHDQEWGTPIHDDVVHFEFLILESAQAGLSWRTILNKRGGYHKAFAGFDVQAVSKYDDEKIEQLVVFEGIVRNRLKIKAAINNARLFITIQQEFDSFDNYIWSFVNNSPIIGHWKDASEVPVTTAESDALSKDLKKRGFKFVGSTIMYAYMQATGLVNDHTKDCFRYNELLIPSV